MKWWSIKSVYIYKTYHHWPKLCCSSCQRIFFSRWIKAYKIKLWFKWHFVLTAQRHAGKNLHFTYLCFLRSLKMCLLMLQTELGYIYKKNEDYREKSWWNRTCIFSSSAAVTVGRTGWRWWRDTSRRRWAASRWSCSPMKSPPLTTTSWNYDSAPTRVTPGSPSSGSIASSAAFPDTRWRTWIMHETAQVATPALRQLIFPAVFFFLELTVSRWCAHQLFFLKCCDVFNAQRTELIKPHKPLIMK